MAPELLNGQCHTEFSDIYALGMVFWELASRKTPFAVISNEVAVKEYVKSGGREEIPEEAPPPFAKLISWCWAQRSSDRPRSVSEIVEVVKELDKSAEDTLSASSDSSEYQHFSHH